MTMEQNEAAGGADDDDGKSIESEGQPAKDDADPEAEEEARGHWTSSADFFVSCLGYAVGLGNIWRFPLLCFQHGGGSFLIPYLTMLFTAGLPVFFLEMSLGQYTGAGPIQIFGRMAPVLKGLGYGMVTVGCLLAFFYNVVVSWAIWYAGVSILGLLGDKLAWTSCSHDFNSKMCVVDLDQAAVGCADVPRESSNESSCRVTSSVEEYWERNVLGHVGYDWENFGQPRLDSVLALGAAWILVTMCLIKGVKTSGRVAYVTSLLPYLILAALAIRSFTLPGAMDGLAVYFRPRWHMLAKFDVWVDAATQIIFSLGPACGCVITLASYNKFRSNCQRDAIAIALANGATSVASGCVVFAILGFMAHLKKVDVLDVVKGGPGLAFLAYPEVVTKMPASGLMATMFFVMLISLALGSIFGAFETVVTALSDKWPDLRAYKPQLVMLTSFLMFILGLPFTCPGGIHMFTLFNSSAPSWNLLVFALMEVLIVSRVYGLDKFFAHLDEMGLHSGMKRYWRVCWQYLTPLVLSILLVIEFLTFGKVNYENYYVYPMPVQILGYCITGSSLMWVPVMAVLEHRKRASNQNDGNESSSSLLRPTQDWGRQKSYGSN